MKNGARLHTRTQIPGNLLTSLLISCVLLVCSLSEPLLAQESREISGVVTDSVSQQPLPGVTVTVRGSETGTSTAADGTYTISAAAGDILIFSLLGFRSRELEVSDNMETGVALQEDFQQLEEAIVIGYGTAQKKDLTGSVTRVDASTYQNQSTTQLTEMLAGTVAGFESNQGTEAAGGSSMEIRGANSLNATTDPMIVLDGVIYNGSIRDINPSDIETIDILKDASSAAIFGARAASGVILVTTRQGRTGKPIINFSTTLGISRVLGRDYAVRGPQGYLDYRRDFFRTLGLTQPDYYWFNPEQLPEGVSLQQWREASNNPHPDDTREWLGRLNFFPEEVDNYLAGHTIDWAGEVFQPALRQDYNVDIGGGTENIKYYWSAGWLDNEGIVRGDEFSAIRSRLNIDFTITDWLNMGVNAQYSKRDESAVPANLNGMATTGPYASMYEEDGSLKWYPHGYIGGANPLINYRGQDRLRTIQSFFASIYGEIKLPLGITYRLSFQPRTEAVRDYNYWSPETITGGDTYSQGRAVREEFNSSEWMIDNLLKWNGEFGAHRFDVTLLYNAEKFKSWSSDMSNQTFLPSPDLGYHGMQFGNNPGINTDDRQYSGDGLMGRVNYTLLDKYLFTLSVRRDGFSAFGRENPYAVFPAAAFAWRLSEERFFDLDFVSDLKLRVSWGVNGNRDIGPYDSFSQMDLIQYFDGTDVQAGVYTSTLSNPGLVWEETESLNFGLDLSMFSGRINMTLDYYDMSTRSLLVSRSLPRVTGFESVTTNIGVLGNKGFELTINTHNINSEQIRWTSGFTFSLNRNKIESLFGETGEYILEGATHTGEVPDFENEWFIGQPIDVVWDYDIAGVWQTGEAEEAARYNLRPGDYKARDLDNNGAYEALQDKRFIGYTEPRYRLGLRNQVDFLKHFSASLFIRADLGHLRPFGQSIQDWSTFDRRSTLNFPYWTPDNASNEYPRLNMNDSPFGGGITPYKPSWFVRIQDVSLSYSLPPDVFSAVKFRSMRLFASVRNLYSFDDWPGWDPESGDAPMPQTFTLGLNVSL